MRTVDQFKNNNKIRRVDANHDLALLRLMANFREFGSFAWINKEKDHFI